MMWKWNVKAKCPKSKRIFGEKNDVILAGLHTVSKNELEILGSMNQLIRM